MKKFIGVFLAIILIISQSTLVFADKNGANLNLKCKSAAFIAEGRFKQIESD